VYLYARGDEQVAVRWSVTALAIQTTLTIALIPRFGAAGAAAALASSEIAVLVPLLRAVGRPAPHEVTAPLGVRAPEIS
jgi:O-antigen/teichoic acid export membrane protein